MFDLVATLRPDGPLTVLDLACGPGAISVRLLDRFPDARSVAVDVDPVLLAIGQGAHGDLDGRLRWVRADLRDPDWPEALGDDGAAGTFDAALSSTALHWLEPPVLAATYRRAAELLRHGGVLVNADHLPAPAGPLHDAMRTIDGARQERALTGDVEDWAGWWDAVEREPALADALAERRALWPEGSRHWTGAGLAFHVAALTEAGFGDVEVVWQDLEERVLAAVR
ncbi:class I SAM-dependent methyltransferase [Nitriliruptoraceae bacterium ZYF776]|nr:class I SAM-dependent methyltransferase [Profundirhabdus halotolerans]